MTNGFKTKKVTEPSALKHICYHGINAQM